MTAGLPGIRKVSSELALKPESRFTRYLAQSGEERRYPELRYSISFLSTFAVLGRNLEPSGLGSMSVGEGGLGTSCDADS
jgi:hypothetical protein